VALCAQVVRDERSAIQPRTPDYAACTVPPRRNTDRLPRRPRHRPCQATATPKPTRTPTPTCTSTPRPRATHTRQHPSQPRLQLRLEPVYDPWLIALSRWARTLSEPSSGYRNRVRYRASASTGTGPRMPCRLARQIVVSRPCFCPGGVANAFSSQFETSLTSILNGQTCDCRYGISSGVSAV
jgi:hypothetical protein